MRLTTTQAARWLCLLLTVQGLLTSLVIGLYLAWALLFATVAGLVEPVLPYLDKLEQLEIVSTVPTSESAALVVVYYHHLGPKFDFDALIKEFFSQEDPQSITHKLETQLQRDGLWDDFVLVATVLELTMDYVKVVDQNYVFPVTGNAYSYVDSWHAARNFGGKRQHLGTDIMCAQGTPLIAVSQGTIERLGWDRLGGWRLGLRGVDGNYYYYAHLARYASGVVRGQAIQPGQLLGYAGSSGYGPQGTTGKFPPHLHFGIYQQGRAVNPYPFLRLWEGKE